MNNSGAGKRKRSTSDPAQQLLIEPPTSNDSNEKEAVLPPAKVPRQASYAQANLLSFFSRPPPKQPKEEGDKGRARLEIGYAQTQQPTTNEKAKAEEDKQKGQEEREEEEEEVEMKKGGRVAQQLMWRGASSGSAGRAGPNDWREVWDGIVRYRAEHKVPSPLRDEELLVFLGLSEQLPTPRIRLLRCLAPSPAFPDPSRPHAVRLAPSPAFPDPGGPHAVQVFFLWPVMFSSPSNQPTNQPTTPSTFSQTRDQSTAKAMRQLQDSLAGGVNVQTLPSRFSWCSFHQC